MSKKKRKLICDPGICDKCTCIGEGDFICDKYIGDPERAMVIEDWSLLRTICSAKEVYK